MPRTKAAPSRDGHDAPQTWRNRLWFWGLRVVAAVAVVGACWGGLALARRWVEHAWLYPSQPPAVQLKNRPVWMTDLLAQQIERAARPRGANSALDHDLLRTIADSLKTNPWIRQVHGVRRVYGQTPGDTIEVDCTYREPRAMVLWGIDYYLVDAEGVLLPEKFSARDVPAIMFVGQGSQRQVNVRVIEGVKSARPVEPGEKWNGADVTAGLELAGLLYGRACAEDIWRINVENFAGRRSNTESQITLKTRHNTEVRWGEPLNATFHVEVDAAQKLQRLNLLKEQYGRVDANHSWVDIRFDKVTCPANENQSADNRR